MIHTQDADFVLHVGDVFDILPRLDAGSVHCVVTSPPYWGLRDYGATGQLGLEPTPDEYVARMVDVFREVRRVLRDDGTCWVNLGDSYNSAASNDWTKWDRRNSETAGTHPRQRLLPGLKPKDLVGIPWRGAFALQADGWYLRADVIWAKPNPMPESVTDRPTKAHEYVFLLSKRPRYFFDQEAVREPGNGNAHCVLHTPEYRPGGWNDNDQGARFNQGNRMDGATRYANPAGRNARSVWEIATQPYPDAHFATFPEELARRCILAGTSERGVCPECGAPWTREVEKTEVPHWKGGSVTGSGDQRAADYGANGKARFNYDVTTTGWRSTCACDVARPDEYGSSPSFAPVPATVLDPFLGSGTVAHVARKHGRRSVGVELQPAYADLAARRLQQLSLLAGA